MASHLGVGALAALAAGSAVYLCGDGQNDRLVSTTAGAGSSPKKHTQAAPPSTETTRSAGRPEDELRLVRADLDRLRARQALHVREIAALRQRQSQLLGGDSAEGGDGPETETISSNAATAPLDLAVRLEAALAAVSGAAAANPGDDGLAEVVLVAVPPAGHAEPADPTIPALGGEDASWRLGTSLGSTVHRWSVAGDSVNMADTAAAGSSPGRPPSPPNARTLSPPPPPARSPVFVLQPVPRHPTLPIDDDESTGSSGELSEYGSAANGQAGTRTPSPTPEFRLPNAHVPARQPRADEGPPETDDGIAEPLKFVTVRVSSRCDSQPGALPQCR
eukprot:SAG22_NODE_523_length_9482_cov_4.992548_1_plen_334_part_00